MNVTRRVYVSGKVHNVGYRDWVVRRAQDLRITGWVRNLKDGRVEILASGAEGSIDSLLDACREGPQHAHVTALDASEANDREPKGFTKRFTV